MLHPKHLLLLIIITTTIGACSQNTKPAKNVSDDAGIIFRDTIFNFVIDSSSHHLGQIVPTNKPVHLVKHFKYIGTEPIIITRAWTEDPHYICEYPKEQLVPNKVYPFTICFSHEGKRGAMSKRMGFILSDGNIISVEFTGFYIEEDTDK